MANSITRSAPAEPAIPVRRITREDLNASLAEGYADFMAKRGDLIFVGILYPLVGILTTVLLSRQQVFLLFPLFAGLALLGPLVATGFYELARRREEGRDTQWYHFFDVLRSPSFGSIFAVGVGLFALFAAWIGAAAIIYALFFGAVPPASTMGFFTDVFTTPQGWGMIVAGLLVGLGFAVLVLAVSVVSLPLLVDKRVTAEQAVTTSLAAFRLNTGPLLRWGFTVAAILVLGAIPLLIGLAAALPILGYATWHLYTRLVDREAVGGE